MWGFYLAFPSGSSFTFFPGNTLTSFTTKIYEVVDLKREWKYGVVEISCTDTHYNVEDCELTLTKIAHDGRGDTSDSDIPTLTNFTIPGGNYHTIKGLLSILNNVVPNPSADAGGVNFGSKKP